MARWTTQAEVGCHDCRAICGRQRVGSVVFSRPMKPSEHLKAADPVLARIVVEYPFKVSRGSDIYLDLLESILSQQLSVKAAATIHERFLDLFPQRYPEPQRLRALSDEALRVAGVSRQKAGYVRNVAAFAADRGLDRKRLARLTDDEVIMHLTQIKGVGRWTVEMLLMFSLHRPDVFPVDDLGIQVAMKKLYRLRSEGRALRQRMEQIAEAWRPYRTHACKCLWRWRHTR